MGHPQPMQTRGTRVVPTRGLRVYTRHGTGTGRVFNTGGKTRAIAYQQATSIPTLQDLQRFERVRIEFIAKRCPSDPTR
jgi:hypothetical protein